MNQPAQHKGPNVTLVIILAIVGLVVLALGGMRMMGCYLGWNVWPWDHSWRFGLFGPHYGMFGLWGLIQIALAIWVGVDANRRGLSGFLWGLLVFFTSVVGLIVYLIVSPTLQQRNGTSAQAVPEGPGPPGVQPAACPSCGGQMQADFKVCPTCGTAVQVACRGCGRQLQTGWKVCPYCGTSGVEPPAPPQS